MTELSMVSEDHLSVSENLAQILSLFELNTSDTALTQDEQNQLLGALEQHLQTNPVDQEALLTDIINSHISKYVPPLLLLIGIFGNILSLVVLLNRTMMRQTTNIFLAVLALSDCIVLLVGLLRRWTSFVFGVDIQRETSLLCKTVTLSTYSSSHFSVWLIVAVTVMRYIAVSKPLKASRFCNRKIASRLIVSLAFAALAINSHFIWTVKLKEYDYGDVIITKCEAEEGFEDFIHSIWPWIDASLFALAPFLLLVIFNTLIVVQTLQATIWRRQNQRDETQTKRKMSRNNVKLTVTLLTVSFSFLVTTLPMATVMVLQNYWRHDFESSHTVELLSQNRLVRTIAEMLMYLNHSINFFLYCAVGEKFRNQVTKVFCRRERTETSRTSEHSSHLYCSRHGGKHAHIGRERTGSTWL